jgi:hypothetical protein
MDLLERYLQAVGQYLPEETREDTIAELRANLLERMDARSEELGRPLEQGDVEAILREHGKPELVALRYLPQQSLIGPTIYPFYRMTMARVLPLVIFVSAIVGGIDFVTGLHGSPAHALVGFALGLIPSLFISAAVITIIFATIERTLDYGKLKWKWDAWDPAKLPAVRVQAGGESTPKSAVKRVIDLIVHCLWMAYVLWVPWHPFWLLGPGVFYLDTLGVALAPAWHTFYVLLVVLLVIQLAMKLIAFLPSFQSWMKPLKLGTDVLGVVAIGFLAWVPIYFLPAGPAADLDKIAQVNHAVGVAFKIAFGFSVVGLQFLKQGWGYLKRRFPAERFVF